MRRTLWDILWLVGIVLAAAPSSASAQRTAGVVVHSDAAQSAEVARVATEVLTQGGFVVRGQGEVDAAASFAVSGDQTIDASRAPGFRTTLGVELLVVVSARAGEGEQRFLAVERYDAAGRHPYFGQTTSTEMVNEVRRVLTEAYPAPLAVAPPGFTTPGLVPTQPAVAPVMPGTTVQPGVTPVQPGVTPVQPGVTPVQPGVVQPLVVQPGVVQPGVVQPGGLAPGTPLPVQPTPGTGVAPPSPIAVQPAPGTSTAWPTPNAGQPGQPAATPGTYGDPVESGPELRTTRFRLIIAGVAGFLDYGYGVGLRLAIPFGGPIAADDDSIGLMLDLGGVVNDVPVDDQHNMFAVGVQLGASLAWRFAIDDVELGPRFGAVFAFRFGEVSGPRAEGSRTEMNIMGLVGFQLAVGSDTQFYSSVDVAIGVDTSVVLGVGVAL